MSYDVPAREELKAMDWPSGDQSGFQSETELLVRRLRTPVFRSST
jgi:hypothetical protein